MALFTINSGGVIEWDSLSGGSTGTVKDVYTISNLSTLKINTDTYQCLNHSTAFGSVDTVSFGGVGGTFLIDPTEVRVIPFNSGSGTVPTINTVISQGGVSGNLLGVWANWQSEPLAAAAAMPASGYIKIKSVSGGSFASGALTGIAASATGPDVQGWIEVRGSDTSVISITRTGEFKVVPAWFDLGLTNGSNGQILECPTTATVAGVFPGVWIETSPGSGIYDQYPGVGSIAANANIPTDAIRGKVIWQTTAGIRIASDGTNNVGYLPPAGCNVRIPATILTCCTRTVGSGSGPRVLPLASFTSRITYNVSNGGSIDIDGAVHLWYAFFNVPYSVRLNSTAIATRLSIRNASLPLDIDNCIVGGTQVQNVLSVVDISACPTGGLVKDCKFFRPNPSNTIIYPSQNKGLKFLRCYGIFGVTRTSTTTYVFNPFSEVDGEYEDCYVLGHKFLFGAGCVRPKIKNMHYADQWMGTTTTTAVIPAIEGNNGIVDLTVDGIDFCGLTNVQPYGPLIQLSNSTGGTIRNIGTPSSPLSFGTINRTDSFAYVPACKNLKIQRCYFDGTRIFNIYTDPVTENLTVENVRGSATVVSVTSAVNSKFNSVRELPHGNSMTGVYGTHFVSWFTSDTAGAIRIHGGVEPTSLTASYCFTSGGSPRRNGDNGLLLTSVGDQVTWVMPWFCLGHTSLQNTALSPTGTGLANLSHEFQYDIGSGFNGTWLTANASNFVSVGAIDPSVGIRFMFRSTCVTAAPTNQLNHINILTNTTFNDQHDNLYSLDQFQLTLTNLIVGSSVQIETQSGDPRDFRIVSNTTEVFNLDILGDSRDNLRIKVRKGSSSPYYQPYETLTTATSAAQSIFISQILDE